MAESQLKSPSEGRPKIARQGRLEICPTQEILDSEANDVITEVPVLKQRMAISESIDDDESSLLPVRRTVSDTTHVRSRRDVHLRVRSVAFAENHDDDPKRRLCRTPTPYWPRTDSMVEEELNMANSIDESDNSLSSPVMLKAPNVTPETSFETSFEASFEASFESFEQPDVPCKGMIFKNDSLQEAS